MDTLSTRPSSPAPPWRTGTGSPTGGAAASPTRPSSLAPHRACPASVRDWRQRTPGGTTAHGPLPPDPPGAPASSPPPSARSARSLAAIRHIRENPPCVGKGAGSRGRAPSAADPRGGGPAGPRGGTPAHHHHRRTGLQQSPGSWPGVLRCTTVGSIPVRVAVVGTVSVRTVGRCPGHGRPPYALALSCAAAWNEKGTICRVVRAPRSFWGGTAVRKGGSGGRWRRAVVVVRRQRSFVRQPSWRRCFVVVTVAVADILTHH